MARTSRQWVARLAAPAAFLAAATAAVLLVRAGLRNDGVDSARTSTAATVSTAPTTTVKAPKPRPKRTFYVIKRGDTLAIVADQYGTTVEALVELNPGIDPVALTVGQRIRVQ